MVLVHVPQSCTIGGVSYLVANSSVDISLNATMRMSFYIDLDVNSGRPMPTLGQIVSLSQTGTGGTVQTFEAIVNSVQIERAGNYTRWRVDALGLSEILAHRRILSAWGRTNAKDLLSSAWFATGPHLGMDLSMGVGLSGEIEEYSSAYDSLLDLATFAANSTGWVWLCYDDQFRFFDPLAEIHPSAIERAQFAKGSLSLTLDGSAVFNVARQQAWEYTTVTFDQPIIPEDVRRRAFDTIQVVYCATRFTGPSNLNGTPFEAWEFVSGEVQQGTPVPENTPLGEIEVGWSDEELSVSTSVPLLAPPNSTLAFTMPLRIQATFRRLVWTEARHEESIDLYGVREAPVLPNDGGVDVPESLRRLQEFLLQRAYPPVSVSGAYLRTDILPGELREVVMPELGISRQCVVESVKRTYTKQGLSVDVSMRSITPAGVLAARPKPDPLPEAFKRIEKLERSPLNPASATGALWIGKAPISRVLAFQGGIEWEGEFEIAAGGSGITVEEYLS